MLAKKCVRPFSHRGSNRSCSKQDTWSIFPFNGLNVATYIGGISKPKLHGSDAPTSFTHQPNRANTNYRNIITELDIGEFGPVKPRRHHVAHHSGST